MEIREWAQTDTEGFRTLFATCFRREIGEDYCQWKFDNNPAGQAIRYVAVENAQLVGSVNFVPLRLWIDNEMTIAYQSVDTMVHPDFRRRGLFSELTQTALAEMARRGGTVKINFPGSKSFPGYLKLGHQLVLFFEYWCHVHFAVALRHVARAKTRGTSDLNSVPQRLPAKVEPLGCFGPALDVLWENARQGRRIIQERSAQVLQWRYQARPDRRYACYGYVDGGECLGYVVLHGAKLVDIFASGRPQVVDSLLRAACCHQAVNGEPLQHAWLSGGVAQRGVWRGRGWFRVRLRQGRGPFYPRQPVCLYLADACPAFSRELLRPENWYLTMGDTDWA